jgi:hypothetical protein
VSVKINAMYVNQNKTNMLLINSGMVGHGVENNRVSSNKEEKYNKINQEDFIVK